MDSVSVIVPVMDEQETVATLARSNVLPTARETSETTVRLVAIDVPRSPCSARVIQRKNCS